jgi:hypothetical protein
MMRRKAISQKSFKPEEIILVNKQEGKIFL